MLLSWLAHVAVLGGWITHVEIGGAMEEVFEYSSAGFAMIVFLPFYRDSLQLLWPRQRRLIAGAVTELHCPVIYK